MTVRPDPEDLPPGTELTDLLGAAPAARVDGDGLRLSVGARSAALFVP